MADTIIHLVTILYKSQEGINAFIQSLKDQTRETWRLHVIDNASPDNSRQLLRSINDPRIKFIVNRKNLGFAKAANQGLKAALSDGARYVILLNNDTILPSDFLDLMLSEVRLRPDAILAPRVMSMRDPDHAWYAGGHLERGWVFCNIHDQYDSSAINAKQVDYAPGCCLVIPKQVLDSVGFFDERYFVYWEDTDFCLRLAEHRIPIYYLPQVKISHMGGASSGGEFSPAYNKLYYVSYAKLLRKHFGMGNAVLAVARILIREKKRKNYRALLLIGTRMAWGILRS